MLKDFNTTISENYADEYSILHSEAHKRSAFAVGAPALSWHLGFFVKSVDGSTNSNHVIDPKQMAGIAKKFFLLVLDGIDVAEHYEEIREAAKNSANGSGSKVLFLSINDVLLKVAVTPHSDHFTLTIVVDLSKPANVNSKTNADIPEDKVLKLKVKGNSFAELTKSHYLDYAKFIDKTGEVDEVGATNAKYFLQNGIWQRVSSLILKNIMFNDSIQPEIVKGYRYNIFADFRGVLVNSVEMQKVLQTDSRARSENFVGNPGLFRNRDNHILGIQSIFPLINLGDRTFNYKELIGCTLFRERAVYISPLGAPAVYSGARKDNCRPLYFAVAVHENNRWQIGRIIHRLNTMGTLRLLALRDFDKLKAASDEIRTVGEALDRTAREIDDADHTTESKIDAEHQRLVNHKKSIDSIGREITGHIAYRIYLSRHRAHQFNIQLSDLHVGRIEAWQPYDEFVKRRLYPAFDYISRIGERYERLNSNYQRQLLSLNSEMQSTSGQHLVRIQDEVLEAHAFQHIIESIALGYYGGLVFYYISKPFYLKIVNYIIEKINYLILETPIILQSSVEQSLESLLLKPLECGGVPGYCEVDKYWQSFCFTVFCLWAAWRFVQSKLQDKRNKRQLLIKRLGLNRTKPGKKFQLRFSGWFLRMIDRLTAEPKKYKSYYKKDVERLELERYMDDGH